MDAGPWVLLALQVSQPLAKDTFSPLSLLCHPGLPPGRWHSTVPPCGLGTAIPGPLWEFAVPPLRTLLVARCPEESKLWGQPAPE